MEKFVEEKAFLLPCPPIRKAVPIPQPAAANEFETSPPCETTTTVVIAWLERDPVTGDFP